MAASSGEHRQAAGAGAPFMIPAGGKTGDKPEAAPFVPSNHRHERREF
jgi:hypothetical protein